MDKKKFEETCKMGRPFVEENERRVIFMRHMYKCAGRQDPNHPMHSLYTGLWHDFCLNEAGPVQRDLWFERMEFVRKVESGEIKLEQSPSIDIKDPANEYLECSSECDIDDQDCEDKCVEELKESPRVFESPHQQSIAN